MSREMKAICLFCGSNWGAQPLYAQAAREFGRAMAQNNITLVYGGASVGLMGAAANAALEAGGDVIGVITRSLLKKEVAHTELTQLEVVESMLERKERMAELSDAFVAMPGGIGTLDEIFEVYTWTQLGIHDKPSALYDMGGYYTHLRAFLNHMTEQGFLKHEHKDMLICADNPSDLLEQLRCYETPQCGKWVTT